MALILALFERSERRALEEMVADEVKLDTLRAKLMRWDMEDADFIQSLPEEYSSILSDYSPEFESLSLRDNLQSSNAVLITNTEIKDGRAYQIVSRIIKLKSDVRLHYEVGHPIGRSMPGHEFSMKPEGMLVFCSGEPASSRRSVFVYNGRLGAYSDLPLSAAIKFIEQERDAR